MRTYKTNTPCYKNNWQKYFSRTILSFQFIDIKDKVTLADVDISKREEIEKIDKNINFIFHLAAYPVPSLCDFEENKDQGIFPR